MFSLELEVVHFLEPSALLTAWWGMFASLSASKAGAGTELLLTRDRELELVSLLFSLIMNIAFLMMCCGVSDLTIVFTYAEGKSA